LDEIKTPEFELEKPNFDNIKIPDGNLGSKIKSIIVNWLPIIFIIFIVLFAVFKYLGRII